MVGNDIRGDIEGAQKAGLKAVLVRAGNALIAQLHSKHFPIFTDFS